LPLAVIGFGVIQTNHSPVFYYTGELCNTLILHVEIKGSKSSSYNS